MNKMAKNFNVVTVLAVAICISALAGLAHGEEKEEFVISGLAYCDTCRVDFQTKLSHVLSGVKVGLECFNETTNEVKFKNETVTDKFGTYKLDVPGDHEEEMCEVALLESSDSECNDVLPGSIRSDRVSLTNKNGVFGNTRFANVLSFASKKAHANCTAVLLEMGVLPDGLLDH